MNYDEIIDHIKRLPPFVPVKKEDGSLLFDLETVSELARRFDDPQDKLRCIHIAGTNGKGSTAEFLSRILTESGYRTGTFTSPYLSDIREQICVNGNMISEDDFADIFSDVIREAGIMAGEGTGNSPSEFEMTVVASFLYFLRCKCDICVIEAGLGGKYDATNIIRDPLMCLFTSISKDHTAVLGESLESIASIKAGIIKPGCECISVEQSPEVYEVLKKSADEKDVPFNTADKPENVNVSLSGVSFSKSFDGEICLFKTQVSGTYQAENASFAIEAAQRLKNKGFNNINTETVRRALYEVKRRGRFEVMNTKPLVITDGAHNEGGVDSLLKTLKAVFPENYDKGKGFVFIAGIMADKDYEKLLAPVIRHIYKVYTVTPENVRAMSANELARIFTRLGADAEPAEDVRSALETAKKTARELDMPVIAFGSLYYIGRLS